MVVSLNFEIYEEDGLKLEVIFLEVVVFVLLILNVILNLNEKLVIGMVFVCIDLLGLSILYVVIIF